MIKLNLSKVKLRFGLSEFKSKGYLLNATDSYEWIHTRENLIGWTYNFNRLCSLWQHFDKLISCQGVPAKQVRIANNTHMKCYIHKRSMLVTSFNLTFPTINDLGVEIKDVALCNYMKILFNKHWKELE
jgi:hypothetical protein